jgi:hypothetical protein
MFARPFTDSTATIANKCRGAMGANKTYSKKATGAWTLGESDEFKRLRHAVEKAASASNR